MAGIKIVNLPALGRNLASTDLFELSLAGGTGSRKITGQEIINAIPSGLTVGTTTIANGAVGKLLFETTGNVLGETSLFNIDPSNGYLGVGTTTPYFPIDLKFNTLGFYSGPTYYAYLGLNNGSFYLTSYSDFVFGTSVVGNPLTIKQNGNVLINTGTDAGYKLDVNGTARVSGDLRISANIYISRSYAIETGAAFPSYSFNGNSGSGMFQAAANIIGFSTANTERMRIDATGNVGIGTTSPSYKLDVNGETRIQGTNLLFNAGAQIGIFHNSTYAGSSFSIIEQLSSQNIGGLIINSGSGESRFGSFRSGGGYFTTFYVNNAELIRLSTSNNVLIGTTTDAGYKLDVNGTARVKGTGTTSATTSLRVENSAGVNQFSVLDGDGICVNSNGDNAAINIQNGGNTRFTIRQNNAILSFRGEATSIGGFNFSNAILNNDPRNSSSLFTINTPTITLTSGTNTYRALTLNYTINTSGGTNEITGLRISPTLTNTTGTTHYAIYSTAGRVRLEGLPTSPAGLSAGDLYNNLGVLMIV
jgi:hypothetical protein